MNASCVLIPRRFVRKGNWKTWPNDWLPFTWKRPEQQPGYFDTGDLVEGIDKPNKQNPANYATQQALKECESLNLSEEVTRMFTNEFVSRKKLVDRHVQDKTLKVSGNLDRTTLAGSIVRMTYRIRNSRHVIRSTPNDVLSKVSTNWWNGKRMKRLIDLYKFDRAEFERLVQELRLDLPEFVLNGKMYQRIERKRELRRLTDEYCAKLKSDKLAEYEQQLKSKQEEFLRRKAETNKWIESELQQLTLNDSPTSSESSNKL
jgi:hypothetical protein